jgi:hypothetical protein
VKSKITRERIITVEAAKCDHLQIDSADNINLLITISDEHKCTLERRE